MHLCPSSTPPLQAESLTGLASFHTPYDFHTLYITNTVLDYQSSTDQSIVDTDIPFRLAGLAFAIIQLLSIVALMCQVAWQIFFLFLVVFAVSIWYQASIIYTFLSYNYFDIIISKYTS